MNGINRANPIAVFIYFVSVISITMLSLHPLIIIISFIASAVLLFLLNRRVLLLSLFVIVPLVILSCVLNVCFSQVGMTKLFAIGNVTVTKEALLYGGIMGVMYASVIWWFGSLNEVLTSDKIIYLFGKTVPKASTILSVSLSLVPKMIKQYSKTLDSLRSLSVYKKLNFLSSIKLRVKTFSIVVTHSIENSINISDSMSARGYDLKGKKFYGKYSFDSGDFVTVVINLVIFVAVLVMFYFGFGDFFYYPYVKAISLDGGIILVILSAICFNIYSCNLIFSEAKWRYLTSKI